MPCARPAGRLCIAFACLLLTAWPAWAATAAAQDRPSAHGSFVAPPAGARLGFLWEARKGARHAYLLGTLHVGLASDYPPDAATERRLASVDVIALEADVTQAQRTQSALRSTAMYGDGEPGLDRRLDPGLKADCERVLEQLHLGAAAAWRMKPWMLASTLEILGASALDLSPAYATEVYLASLASRLHKPIVEIEGIEAQFALLDAPAWPQQVDFLREAVDSIASGEAMRDLKSMVQAWRSADAAAMQDYLEHLRHSDDAAERQWFERLVTARNAGMADTIDARLQDGRFYLVAVGSLHFFGPDGLIERLRARGYTVTTVPAGR